MPIEKPPEPLDAPLPNVIGSSPAMREVYRLTRLVALTRVSVLLVGETGTGKELIARAIRDSVRDDDLVGRLGGEEFGVFLNDAGFEIAGRAAERIRAAVNALFVTSDGLAQRLSISIGGAVCAGDIGFAELFRVADRRLYAAKHAGRNRVELGGTVDSLDLEQATSAVS